MKKLRLYLDNCCFNRPYDDPSNLLVFLESEAKLFVQKQILAKEFEFVWSYMMDYENNVNPKIERKENINKWRKEAMIIISITEDVIELSNKIMISGIKRKDSLHIACAIKANCDYFLTTDKKLLNKKVDGVVIINPIEFLRELEV